jgi:hypothetical protein
MTSPLALYGNIPEILAIEEELRKLPQVDLPLQHFYLPHVCVRVMSLPAGTLLTGKIHKHTHIAILAKGRLRLADGDNSAIVEAGYVAYGKPGIKRLGYAETDVVFINVLSTDITDIEELEKELVVDTFDEFDTYLLEGNSHAQITSG